MLVDIDGDWWDKFAKDYRADFIANVGQLLSSVAVAKALCRTRSMQRDVSPPQGQATAEKLAAGCSPLPSRSGPSMVGNETESDRVALPWQGKTAEQDRKDF